MHCADVATPPYVDVPTASLATSKSYLACVVPTYWDKRLPTWRCHVLLVAVMWYVNNRYYMVDKTNTLPCILFTFIEIKLLYYYSYLMLMIKPISICND